MKMCRMCLESKTAGNFYAKPESRDGLYSYCKACTAKRNRASREARPEVFKERSRAYRKANYEAIRKSARAYREADPERHRRYYKANNEAILAHARAYVSANREAIGKKRRARYAANREAMADQALARYNADRVRRRARSCAQNAATRLWATHSNLAWTPVEDIIAMREGELILEKACILGRTKLAVQGRRSRLSEQARAVA